MAGKPRIIFEESHYEPPRRRRQLPKPKLQPPMTPMIDCVFQLLLFFLIGSTFRDEANIPGSIPRRGPGPANTVTVVVLVRQEGVGANSKPIYSVREVSGDKEMRSSGEKLSQYRETMAQSLYEELYRIRGDANDKVPIVIKPVVDYNANPDAYVRWSYVADAYNQALRAGFKEIGFEWEADIEAARGSS